MKKRWWLLLIPALFVLIPVGRLVLGSNAEEADREGTPVVVSRPERRSLARSLTYPGNLRAGNTAVAVPRISGRIERVLVGENERVNAGEVIVELESEMVRIQMEQARAAWRAALAQYEEARRGAPEEEIENARATIEQSREDLESARADLNRTERLYEAGTVSRADFEDAQNQFQSAETQLANAQRSLRLLEQGASEEQLAAAEANADAARRQFELARLQFQYSRVTAPVSGTVSRITVEEGNTVNVGTPLLSIINDDLIYVSVHVPERHYGSVVRSLDSGVLSARVRPVAYEGELDFDGRVSFVGNTIDPQSRTFEVEIATENTAGRLRPGMFVNVELVLDVVEQAIAVPSTAIVRRNGEQVAFVLAPGDSTRAISVPVELGIESEGWVEVVSGIEEDSQVVVEGNAFLEDEQSIRLVEGS